MIVDDEYVVRLGISSIIDWESHGYTICGLASDGQDALDQIDALRPDIILADVLMSPMNGLELLERCVRKYPKIQFIMLSNSTDFQHVKRALQLGACDYIFKLEINELDLLKALSNAKVSGASKNRELEDMWYVRHKLLDCLVSGLAPDSERVTAIASQLGIRFSRGAYQIMVMQLQHIQPHSGSEMALRNAVQNIIDRFSAEIPEGLCMWWKELYYVFYLPEEAADMHSLKSFFDQVSDYVKRYTSHTVVAAVSEIHQSDHPFRIALHSTAMSLEQYFYTNATAFIPHHIDFKSSYNRKEIRPVSRKLAASILHGQLGQWETDARLLFEELRSRHYAPDVLKAFILLVLESTCIEVAQQIQTDHSTESSTVHVSKSRIDRSRTFEELEQYVLAVLSSLFHAKQQLDFSPEVLAAKAYILENVSRKITLSEVAQHVNISESYFSHLFKKEVGVGFVDYVNNLKIEQAKLLLSKSRMKVVEVASALGFDNPNYFNILFKRLTGVTPGSYCENPETSSHQETS